MNKLEKMAVASLLVIAPAMDACAQKYGSILYETVIMDEDGNVRHAGGGTLIFDKEGNIVDIYGNPINNKEMYKPKNHPPQIRIE